MTWPEGVALELLVLSIGWVSFKFLTRNVRSFLELRQEIRGEMRRFGSDPPSGEAEKSPGRHPPVDPDLEQGTDVFRQLGFEMLLFAQTARMAAWVVKMMGYDPIKAGDNLISLAHSARETSPAFRRKSIADALRFNDRPPNHR